MTQTQTQANRSRLLQEIENNDKEIAERDAAATKILQEVTAIGDMMRELDHLAKLQAPMLGIFLSLISPLPLASLLLLRRTFSCLPVLLLSALVFSLLHSHNHLIYNSDSIEANIEQVDEHAKVAVVELREARANQKSCIISWWIYFLYFFIYNLYLFIFNLYFFHFLYFFSYCIFYIFFFVFCCNVVKFVKENAWVCLLYIILNSTELKC